MTLQDIKNRLKDYDYKGKTKLYFSPIKLLKTWKFWRIVFLILWVIGFIAPFIGYGFIQGIAWALPVGYFAGTLIAEIINEWI